MSRILRSEAHPTSSARAARRRRALVPVLRGLGVLCLFTQLACGGAEDAQNAAADPSETGGSGGSSAGGTGGGARAGAGGAAQNVTKTESVDLDATVWHAGIKTTFTKATLSVAAGSNLGKLTLETEMENLGASTAAFDSRLVLTDGSADYEMDAPDGFPDILGARSKSVALVASVDADFDLTAATLLIGNPANNQAIVPIGKESPDDLLTLEPLALDVKGTATAGSVEAEVSAAVVRADDPASHDEADADHLFLTLDFAATLVEGSSIGGENLMTKNFQLKTPDGNALAPTSYVNELLRQVDATVDGLSLTFVVPKPLAGTYSLTLGGNYAESEEHAEGSFEFDVPELENFAE